ncbi:MAG: hypothetical protein GF414_01475 [Candidatus Altiarchaeales archaeon]|nr:hypothetical protein [Candidatus Altiarchaeales archaeon]
MRLSGTGISTPFELKIIKYTPRTTLALEWVTTSSGNYVATDRGASADIYETEVTVHGCEYYTNWVLDAIGDNRTIDSNVLTLDTFHGDDDQIFGCDIDYSSGVSVTVTDLKMRKQRSWHGHAVTMTLRALSPSFVGAASLPTLQYISRGYTADATWTMSKIDTYDNTFTYLDQEYDAGMWSGDIVLPTADMRSFRRYLATQRDATISIPDIKGVLYPYGPRRGNTYPLSVKVTDFKDRGPWGLNYWIAGVTFNEVVSEV